MRHDGTMFRIVITAGILCVVGCRSKPVLHTNASCGLTDTQVASFTTRALAGDGDAAWRLCEYYAFIKYDQASALKWMTVAAEDGNVSGQYNLAHEYEGAFDKSRLDLKKARYWYQRAADGGDVDAKRKLAELNNK